MAESAALTWRVSSSTVSNPALARPACSHWLSGPASSPIRTIVKPSPRQNPASTSGSLVTLASRTILPVVSTTQRLLDSNETSMPMKCSTAVSR